MCDSKQAYHPSFVLGFFLCTPINPFFGRIALLRQEGSKGPLPLCVAILMYPKYIPVAVLRAPSTSSRKQSFSEG